MSNVSPAQSQWAYTYALANQATRATMLDAVVLAFGQAMGLSGERILFFQTIVRAAQQHGVPLDRADLHMLRAAGLPIDLTQDATPADIGIIMASYLPF